MRTICSSSSRSSCDPTIAPRRRSIALHRIIVCSSVRIDLVCSSARIDLRWRQRCIESIIVRQATTSFPVASSGYTRTSLRSPTILKRPMRTIWSRRSDWSGVTTTVLSGISIGERLNEFLLNGEGPCPGQHLRLGRPAMQLRTRAAPARYAGSGVASQRFQHLD